jgi:uncharacterized SAM-binding protein YcdF (DUF218 family)
MKVKNKNIIKALFRAALILSGCYIINLYIGPLISLGVLNAGNLFGFGIAGLLILCGLFFDRLTKLIKSLLKSGKGKAFLAILCVLSVSFFTMFFATLAQVVDGSKYSADGQSTVIVLGCHVNGSLPGFTLQCRCLAAADYLNTHPEAVVIATGGQGFDEDISEAQCIYNTLTENGIDPDKIYIEDKSVSTVQNIENAKKIIDDNGLSTEVALATSEYHEYRAAGICEQYGLTAASLPSASVSREKATFFTREVFAVWAQRLKDI